MIHIYPNPYTIPLFVSLRRGKECTILSKPVDEYSSGTLVLYEHHSQKSSEEVSLSGSTESDYAIETYYNKLIIPVIIILGSFYIKSLF